jgi:beta-lactam-binding protein with PASTA domain
MTKHQNLLECSGMRQVLGSALLIVLFALAGCASSSTVGPAPSTTSTPEPRIAVPDVRGESVAVARINLANVGFNNVALHPAGDGTPDGTWIVKDEANVGANVSRFATIDLTVYLKNIPVPDLTNLTVNDATNALTKLGLIFVANADALPTWIVQSQDVAAGTMAGATDVVTVQATEPPPPPQFDTYTVTGNGTAFVITYSTGSGTSQDTNVRLPWTKQIPAAGSFLYVSAQDQSGTTITCSITGPDGETLATNTATGRYAIAQCSS